MSNVGQEQEDSTQGAHDIYVGIVVGIIDTQISLHQEKIHLLENGLKVLKMAF